MPYHNAQHLPDGADPITVKAGNIEASAVETAKIKDKAVTMAKLADHAVSVDYTATLNTTWSGSAAPTPSEQTINGILATDKPLIDIVPSATFADAGEAGGCMGAHLPRGDGGEQDNVLRQGKADSLDTPCRYAA